MTRSCHVGWTGERRGRAVLGATVRRIGGGGGGPDADVRVFIVHRDGETLLEVGGELDLATVDRLAERLDLIIESGIGDVVVDMSMVSFCDALTLRVLIESCHRLGEAGRAMHVAAPSHAVGRLLEAAAVTWLLDDPVRSVVRRRSS